jgi:hypothetical protein
MMFCLFYYSMNNDISSEEVRKSIITQIEQIDIICENFEVEDEMKDTNHIRLTEFDTDVPHHFDIRIDSSYISIKYSISDEDSIINISHRFFESSDEGVGWIEEALENQPDLT